MIRIIHIGHADDFIVGGGEFKGRSVCSAVARGGNEDGVMILRVAYGFLHEAVVFGSAEAHGNDIGVVVVDGAVNGGDDIGVFGNGFTFVVGLENTDHDHAALIGETRHADAVVGGGADHAGAGGAVGEVIVVGISVLAGFGVDPRHDVFARQDIAFVFVREIKTGVDDHNGTGFPLRERPAVFGLDGADAPLKTSGVKGVVGRLRKIIVTGFGDRFHFGILFDLFGVFFIGDVKTVILGGEGCEIVFFLKGGGDVFAVLDGDDIISGIREDARGQQEQGGGNDG